MGCRQSQNSPALELVEVHELSLHIFYTRTEGVMIHFSSSSSFCSSIIHSHLKSSNPTETSNSHLFKSATQKSQERSSRAPFASKMFSNDLRIPLVCSRACNDSSTSSSTSWAFSRMYSNLLSCAMKPLDILGLPEDCPAGFHALTMAGSSNHTILAVVDTLW